MKNRVYERLRGGRGWFYGICVPIVIGLVLALSTGQMSSVAVVLWIGLLVTAIGAYEVTILSARPKSESVQLAATLGTLLDILPSMPSLIASSGAAGVDILGGTLKTFTDRRENLEALNSLYQSKAVVRILALDPDGDGVASMARQRALVGAPSSESSLRDEVRTSLERLNLALGQRVARECIRLYPDVPHHSMYRLGDRFLTTIYRFGRGGSSPSMFMRRDGTSAAFCDSLAAGFDDVWNSQATVRLTDAKLRRKSLPSPAVR